MEKLLDRSAGDAVIDYREGDAAVVQGLTEAIRALPGSRGAHHAFDAVSEHNSFVNLGKVLAPGARMTLVLPGRKYEGVPEGIHMSQTMVGCVHDKQTDFGAAYFGLMAKGLAEGWFRGHPTQVVPGGLAGVQKGLRDMREGRNSAVKYVFRIAETPGLAS